MSGSQATNFRWLRSGNEAFPAIRKAVEGAKRSIRLEMYIYSEAAPGNEIRDALVEAARRGVKVWVLLDAFGSFGLSADFWRPLVEAGGEFQWFNPLKLGRMPYRDHRKLLVCDETTAIIGGFNIAPEYVGDGITTGWRDVGMEIRGGLVGELAQAFDRMFTQAGLPHRVLQRMRKSVDRATASGESWRLLLSGPGRGYHYLKRTLGTDLGNAHTVSIISAYFLPTWSLRRALERVRRRGGRVQLVLAGKSDVRLSQLATQRLYRWLMKRGVEVFEYVPQVLHAKLYIVDEQVYVGSSNMDARSLNINYELLVRLSDSGAVSEGRKIFAEVLTHSRRVNFPEWQRSRSLWAKLMEHWAYFILARLDVWWARVRLKDLR